MQFNQSNLPEQMNDPRLSHYYLYGRKPLYGTATGTASYGQAHDHYRHNSFLSGKSPGRLDGGPQTVEQLVDQGYFAVPRREPEIAILHDRRDTSWLGLDDVLTQVRQRHEIYKQNILDLQWSECYAFNELARSGWPATQEQYAIYERRMQDLRADKRAERVTLWRDASRLRERIPESAQNYLSTLRKLELLNDTDGDLI